MLCAPTMILNLCQMMSDCYSHFAIQFAKALECESVVVFSHSANKKVSRYFSRVHLFNKAVFEQDDAMKLGATEVVITGKSGFEESLTGQLDLIIVCYVIIFYPVILLIARANSAPRTSQKAFH